MLDLDRFFSFLILRNEDGGQASLNAVTYTQDNIMTE
jgi:hypothetical protein